MYDQQLTQKVAPGVWGQRPKIRIAAHRVGDIPRPPSSGSTVEVASDAQYSAEAHTKPHYCFFRAFCLAEKGIVIQPKARVHPSRSLHTRPL